MEIPPRRHSRLTMYIYNSTKRLNRPAMLAAALFFVGCFNVEKVDVTQTSRPRLLIDDFEDGDLWPSTSLFKAWDCYSFIPEQPPPTCDLTAGFDSTFAYSLKFELQSPPVASPDGVGAGASLVPLAGTVDLSTYATIRFSVKMDPASPGPPPGIIVAVNFGCNSVGHPPGSVRGGFMVEYPFNPAADWQSFAIALADFQQPSWQTVRMFDKSECAKLVDVLNFNVKSPLGVGQSVAGILTFDDVWLE